MRNASRLSAGRRENAVIVGIVDYHKPPAVSLIAKPIIHESEDINLWVIAPGEIDLGGNVSIGLLESGSIARMHPKYPGVRRRLPYSVRILDGNLRFPRRDMSLTSCWMVYSDSYPTPPRPMSATRLWSCEAACPCFSRRSAMMSSRPTNVLSLWNGTMIDGLGLFCARTRAGPSLARKQA